MRAVLTPSCMEELFTLLEQHPQAMPMAGGTDLLVRLRGTVVPDERPLLALANVQGLCGIHAEGTTIAIGAATPFSRIIADPLIAEHAPLLAQAARTIGGPAVRNMATIGGNICTASPAGDSLPPLYLLEAELELAAQGGSRRLPIQNFITGPGKTALLPGEILTRIRIPLGAGFTLSHFEKTGRRKSMAIAIASMAALLRTSGTGTVQEIRLAWGSVAPMVVRVPEAEQLLAGAPLTLEALHRAAAIISASVSPIDDIRASAGYRRAIAGNLLLRLPAQS